MASPTTSTRARAKDGEPAPCPAWPPDLPPADRRLVSRAFILQELRSRRRYCSVRTAHRVIFDAERAHQRRLVQVTAVEHDRALHAARHFGKIGAAEFLPLRDDDKGIRAVQG